MCTIKEEVVAEIKARYKAKHMADVVGITNGYLTQIFQGKPCSKPTAYCIVKYLNPNAELEDYFIINK